MVMYDPEYLRLARALCDRTRFALVADEIAVGCGRDGSFFACEQAGIQPDFLLLSKGISGGYLPLSIVLTTDDVYAAFYDDDTARGFPALPLLHRQSAGLPGGLATLDIFAQDDVISTNRHKAARHSNQ